jgi:ligand-binding SRPBCC domain-containing protein
MLLCSLTEKLELDAPIEKVFQFFLDTEQIPRVLPPGTALKILRRSARHLSQGATVDFEARVFGAPFRYKMHVHSLSSKRHMTCVSHRNSWISWEHNFYFESMSGGQTRVSECLLYWVPMGPFGIFLNRWIVDPYLKKTMDYRREALHRVLGSYQAKTTLTFLKSTSALNQRHQQTRLNSTPPPQR